MASVIRPFARALYLCDYIIGYENDKVDLYGLFNTIRPTSYPHRQDRFCVFAQLTGGLGDVRFFIDVLLRPRNRLVRTTAVRHLHFPTRTMVVQMKLEIQGCPFPEPGDYLLELHCEDLCIADVPLRLLEVNNGEEEEEEVE